jgi:exopolyphosphatase/guanosine-5'-triphosphate,3'-diphosphate pyrophosphatase
VLFVSVAQSLPVAVIDIGSNSIKSLVAGCDATGGIAVLGGRTIDARISVGIGQARPRLSDDGMRRGLAAIRELLQDAAPFSPARTVLVATSAVRDAANGTEFAARIKASTGCELRILSGDEEANLIGRGLTVDPQLADLQDFYVFDLGGGSLECLAFRGRHVEQALSLPLGCVRLTERCVEHPEGPFSDRDRARVAEACRDAFDGSGFRFSLPAGSAAVFAGGTVTTVRAIAGERSRLPILETNPVISVDALRRLLEETALLPLPARRQIPGLPESRADVFPTALATLLAVAETAGFSSFRHSFHNLRYGLAAELLRS